jgi:hypothetical protein
MAASPLNRQRIRAPQVIIVPVVGAHEHWRQPMLSRADERPHVNRFHRCGERRSVD